MLKKFIFVCITLIWSINAFSASGNPYPLPPSGNQIVGNVFKVKAHRADNLSNIGMRYHIGFHEMLEANQSIRPWHVQRGAQVLIPKRFLLPEPRKGIVINLAELRLYYYPPERDEVWTFPIGIGRKGWNTPTATTKVVRKKYKPTWNVPKTIRKFIYEVKGILLPKKVLPGPENPLGDYAIYLALNGYLIHGTNAPWSIGKRVSSGCIRLLPHDIEALYHMVNNGTPVKIINEPIKAGWQGNALYLEAHLPLSDQAGNTDYHRVIEKVTKNRHVKVDWNLVDAVSQEQHGLPTIIGYAID